MKKIIVLKDCELCLPFKNDKLYLKKGNTFNIIHEFLDEENRKQLVVHTKYSIPFVVPFSLCRIGDESLFEIIEK